MNTLNPAQRGELKARAHALHPVVSIASKGLAPTVLAEIDRCLKAHELIKVRVYGAERDDREALLAELCAQLDAAPVQHIGNILVIFRARPAEVSEESKSGRGKSRIKAASHGQRQAVERGELRNTRKAKPSAKSGSKFGGKSAAKPTRRRTLGYRLER